MKFKNPFKTNPVSEQEVEVEKESLIDKARRSDGSRFIKPPVDRAGILATMFPRTHADLHAVSAGQGGVAMDGSSASELTTALDASFDGSSLMPSEIPDQILEFFGSHSFIGWQACAVLRQNYLINNACSIPAQDAMASDYLLSYAENNKTQAEKDSDEGVDEERLAELKQIADDDYDMKGICQRLTINKKTFGIGLAIPIVDGADMSKPYNVDGIKAGSYKGFSIVEPYWCAPQMDADAASNPATKHFYEPTWWRISGKLIHRSWCIKLVNTVLPDIMKPTYYYGGIPLPQMMYERVYAADKTANEAPLLAMTKRLLVMDADVENLVANPEAAIEITKALTFMRDNFGFVCKHPGDQISQIDTNLSDFDDLIMTQYQLAASIAEMPVTKLMKTTPKGFNATGEYEWKDYAQSLVSIQEHDFTPLLKRHFELYQKSEGKPEALTITFNPVDVPSEEEAATVREINSRVDANYADAGIISPEEVRQIIRNEDESRYSTISELAEDTPEDLDDDADKVLKDVEDAAFVESEHPRDDGGKFGEGGGGSSSKKSEYESFKKSLTDKYGENIYRDASNSEVDRLEDLEKEHFDNKKRKERSPNEKKKYKTINKSDYEAEEVDPSDIMKPNETNSDKVKVMSKNMEENGWTGRPILVMETKGGLQGITGSHRIESAKRAGIDVPVVKVDVENLDEWLEDNDMIDDFYDGYGLPNTDDDSPKLMLDALRGSGNEEAAKLYKEELESNLDDDH